ncbi:hypothetical protein BN188_270024 [Clostridioides difficile T19]|nr:hypothetical protein BN188_270024 [Clostridioides difficile T19]
MDFRTFGWCYSWYRTVLATVIVRVITMYLESNITSGKIFKFKKYVIIKEVLV